MDDLVEFLRARLDEDEQIARAATQGDWVWSREFVAPPGYHHRTVGPLEPGDAAFIVAHQPKRVLREIDAKRGIVARYEFACKEAAQPGISEEERETRVQVGGALQSCVLCLAAPYSDHPDYREEWRP